MTAPTLDPRSLFLLLSLSLIWGFSFFFIGVAVKEIPPLTLAFLRVGLGAAALWIYIWLRGVPVRLDWGQCGALLVMGLLNNAIPFSLIMFGQQTVESGPAAIFNATTPVFTVIAAHLLTRDEKATPLKTLGVVLAIAGAAVIIGLDALGSLDLRSLGQIAIIGAAVSYALAGVWGKRFAGLPKPVIAAGMLTGAALLLIPAILMLETPPASVSWRTIAATAGLALPCTALAYLLYFAILARAGAVNLLLVTVLAAPVAAALGIAFLDETLSAEALIGGVIILVGLSLIDGRLWRGAAQRVGRGSPSR